MWFKTKRETPKAKWNCSIVTDRYAWENWSLNKIAILVLPAKCINKARIKCIYGSGSHCFIFRFLFLNHTGKITSLNRTNLSFWKPCSVL
jgi:hypothetical protein